VAVTLAACIAVNTATFALVHSVLLRPLPGHETDRLVVLANRYPKAGAGAGSSTLSSAADWMDRLRHVTALEEQAMFNRAGQTVDVDGAAERIPGMAVTPSFFPLLRVAPALGRPFTPEEGEVGANRKVILSDPLWRRLYGGDRNIIGRDLRLGGAPYTIVGVMPSGFVFVDPEIRLWTPLAFTPQQKTAYHSNDWTHVGRIRLGSSMAAAQSQVNALNAATLDRFPAFKQIILDAGYHTAVLPLREVVVGNVDGALYLLWAAALFVLLVGALNVANLVVARQNVRMKELATRQALGANRWRLARQLIVENTLLGLLGGAVGLAAGAGLLRVIASFGLERMPRAGEVSLDWPVIAAVAGLSLLTGLLIALAPLAATFKADLSGALRVGARAGTGGVGMRRLRQTLVGAEIGLAFVLVAGAGLLLASFQRLQQVDPGFVAPGVLTASTNAPAARYAGEAELRSLMNRILDSVRAVPGVSAAGAATAVPLSGGGPSSVIFAEGYVMKPGESAISPLRLSVTPGYFETMKIGLVRGRYFDQRDNETAPPAIIVDEVLARRFWPGEDAVGRRMYNPTSPSDLKPGPKTRWLTVVGVVRPVRHDDLSGSRSDTGAYYFAYPQGTARTFTLAVRSTTLPALRAALAGVDPQLALFDVRTMDQRIDLSLATRRTSLTLASAFGALALFLAGLGIYGVLSYLVAQRRREIGIRVALGCTGAGVLKMVLREGFLLTVSGLAAGLAGAVALRKYLAAQVYDVRPLDPFVLGSAVLLLGVIALLACLAPARRAVRVDPVRVLAEE
jgi:predicted permease